MLARRAYDAGQFDEAGPPSTRRSRRRRPARKRAWAWAWAPLGNAAGAIEQLEATLRLDANNVTAHMSLGMVLARSGRTAAEAHSPARRT